MLGPGRYLLGVVEILVLGGAAWVGAAAVRERWLPRFDGAAAGLATGVLALALLVWVAEVLGTLSLFAPGAYLVGVAIVGAALRLWLGRRGGVSRGEPRPGALSGGGDGRAGRSGSVSPALVGGLVVALVAVVVFSNHVRPHLTSGMTGFDSTWYHGPFAAGFFQSGDTIGLHFIAPQFLAWFYPANGELFHAIGMLAFGRDLLSPLLNLGWFVGCLVAAWCIGRPGRVAPWSLGLAAVALSVPALSDQAGEARNDIVGIFFLLAAVAVALDACAGRGEEGDGAPKLKQDDEEGAGGGQLSLAAVALSALAAGLAAGTKLNFLVPAVVLVVGLAILAGAGRRWKAFGVGVLAALAGGGYWYLRNLVHTGNPLPWAHHLGPISLPAPEQALGGREAHSVLRYLGDGSVWSDWFLPGLHHGLWLLWPLLGLAALAGLLLPFASLQRQTRGRRASNTRMTREIGPSAGVLAVAGAVGLAAALAWLVSPTSASGPEGMPRGFESGLRYLAPALVLGLALLPTAPFLRRRLARDTRTTAAPSVRSSFPPDSDGKDDRSAEALLGPSKRSSFVSDSETKDDRARGVGGNRHSRRWLVGGALVLVLAVVVGYPVQRHYLQHRYADPSFTTPGLNAAFAWARGIEDARIATTSTRQYPLFGTDLSNHVDFLGQHRPHGGFEEIRNCRAWRRAIDAGDYDYVVASRDRIEPGKPPYPPQARWTEGPGAKIVLKKPPTVVFKLTKPLDPSACG